MKKSKRILIFKSTFLLICIFIICISIYSQTRQVNVRALSLDIKWVQFTNGLGEPVSRKDKSGINTYWNAKGRKYIKVHLQDGREFDIHYFHSDIGNRRRVLIEIVVDSKENSVVICLFYNGQEVARGNYQLDLIVDEIVDLMILNKIAGDSSDLD